MKKLLYILNVARKLSHFSESSMIAAKEAGYEFHIACNYSYVDDEEREKDEKKHNVKIHQVDFDRNPLSLKNIKAFRQLCKLFNLYDYEVVHCNTPIGGVLGRICAKKNKIKYTIYEAHGFHFYEGAPKKNWLFYYPVEKFLSRYTDLLITINSEDFTLAKNYFHAKQIQYVPGIGINLDKYNPLIVKKLKLRSEWNVQHKLVFLSVNCSLQVEEYGDIVKMMNEMIGKDNYLYFIYEDKNIRSKGQEEIAKLNRDETMVYLKHLDDSLYTIADIFICSKDDKKDRRDVAIANKIACLIYDNTDRCNHELSKLALDKTYRHRVCLQTYQNLLYTASAVKADNSEAMYEVLKLQKLKISLGLKVDDFVLLSVGELNKNKNHEAIIRELPNVKSNVHYLILGQGKLKNHLMNFARKIKVDSRVHFLGYRDNVYEFYKLANIYLHPSFREGLPMALLEAMTSGCQCFASNIRGCRDLLDEMFLFDPYNVDLSKILECAFQYHDNETKVGTYSMKNIIDVMKKNYSRE